MTVARRRRRMRVAGAAVLALASAVLVQVRGLPSGGERTVATPGPSWAPPGFTDLPMSALSRDPSRGWQTALRLADHTGTRVVATFSPASGTPPTPLADGGALVFYVRGDAGASRAEVRRVSPVEHWCARVGGTRELMRVASTEGEEGTARPGYACLKGASPTVIRRTTEILATAGLSL
ncbi:hypothetical protein ABZV34_20475 [Streptomyces sp. NPDC005195]|uniref:hypothetical protein n=1 Tax=Streptomyces sp. NPDC005195 TaxID=3154561 RepID=UPI0033BAC6A4